MARNDFGASVPEPLPRILVASKAKLQDLQRARGTKKKWLIGALGVMLWPYAAGAAGIDYWSKKHRGEVSNLQDWWQQLTLPGDISIPILLPERARSLFRFETGHPIDGTAYVFNPYRPNHYLLPAHANERLAQEKLYAFIELSAQLGAKQIEILSASLETKSVGAAVGLAEIARQIGLNVKIDQAGSIVQAAKWEFGLPQHNLSVPEHLQTWVAADPALASLVTIRQQFKVLTARSSLQIAEMSSIAGEVCSQLAGMGINVGGHYRTMTSSTWDFAIEFWPA